MTNYSADDVKDFLVNNQEFSDYYLAHYGLEGYEIQTRPLIHHINPVTKEMILNRDPMVFDMNNVVTTTHQTHNAIHYGHDTNVRSGPVIRRPNDTCPWKH